MSTLIKVNPRLQAALSGVGVGVPATQPLNPAVDTGDQPQADGVA
jgi:hypothetical protein